MSEVKINSKIYSVPELNFQHSQIMEQCGLPLEGMISRRYIMTAVQAFTVIATGTEPEYAAELIQQHIMGGGNIEKIYESYVNAVMESGFFRKLLHLDDQEKKTTKKSMQKENQKQEES